MRPQQELQGGGTSKSGSGTSKSSGSTSKSIHAMAVATVRLYMLPKQNNVSKSDTSAPTFSNIIMHPTPTQPTFTLLIFLDSLFFHSTFSLFLVHVFSLFPIDFFHSGQMAKFLHGQSEYLQVR